MASKRKGYSGRPSQVSPPPAVQSGETYEALHLLYEELLKSRDRLAGLPPLTPHDIECALSAMHEIIFFLITPPPGRKTELPLPDATQTLLRDAACNRDIDLYVLAVSALAQKIANHPEPDQLADHQLAIIRDALDALTFDYRTAKTEMLANLRELRSDLDHRIAYIRSLRKGDYRFPVRPEAYRSRRDKSERPDQFFNRVYAPHVPLGLTQGDIRKADAAYYNVLHVWCSRHHRKLANLVPPARSRRR